MSLRIKKSNDASANESSLKVDSEIVRARAKYTDMSLAVDVALQLVADFKSDSSDERKTSGAFQLNLGISPPTTTHCQTTSPVKRLTW